MEGEGGSINVFEAFPLNYSRPPKALPDIDDSNISYLELLASDNAPRVVKRMAGDKKNPERLHKYRLR